MALQLNGDGSILGVTHIDNVPGADVKITPVGNFTSTDVQAMVSELGGTSGSNKIGYDGGTVQDVLDAVTGPNGAASVGYTPAGTGAVATTLQAKLWETVSVFDFMTAEQIADVKARTSLIDVTAAIQDAIDYAIINGKSLYIPSGKYLIGSTLKIIRPSGEYRADSLRIIGDGGGSVFLSKDICPGTVIFTNTDIPIFTFDERITGGFNNLYLEYMRLEQANAAATQPVILLGITAGYSRLAHLEIRQNGLGDGIKILKGYLTTIEYTNIVNKDLVNFGGGVSRVGVGINLVSTQAGGLFTARKVTCRGFLTGYVLGNGTVGLLSTKLDQCECSIVTDGVIIQTNMVKTVLETCYFEGVTGKCITDKGTSTNVSECMLFNGYAVGIDSTYTTFGNVYRDNTIYIDGANSIGIDVYADGDAIGHQKLIDGNLIYFLSSGGTVAGVNGVRITGANPSLSILDNNFRPRRAWVGGAGTVKINNASTGIATGVLPLTDALSEFPLYSNIGLSLGYGGTLTQSAVTGGVLAIGAASHVDFSPTVATNVNQLSINANSGRLVLITINANCTLVDGPFMILAGNASFAGPGQILLNVRILGGVTYSYEISRTAF